MDVIGRRHLFLALGIALIALALILGLNRLEPSETALALFIDQEQILTLEIAESAAERRQGLSGRDMLADDVGLLFIFPEPDTYGIWMKDMLFSIDIIWLDEQFQVVNFKKDVAPETYPTIFTPEKPASYVLETQAGFIDTYEVKIGEILDVREVQK